MPDHILYCLSTLLHRCNAPQSYQNRRKGLQEPPDTTAAAEAVVIADLRRFSSARRLQMAADLTRMTRRLSWYGLCTRYPTAAEAELRYRWCALLYGEDLAARYIVAWRACSPAQPADPALG